MSATPYVDEDVCINLDLAMSWIGPIVATVNVATYRDWAVGSSHTLRIGSQSFVLRVARVGHDSAQHTYVVLSNGQPLSGVVPARFYSGCDWRFVLGDTLGSVGMSLASTSSVSGSVPYYARATSQACTVIDAVARLSRRVWRILDDGKLWMGLDEWRDVKPPSNLDPTLVSEQPHWAQRSAVVEEPFLRPGVSYQGMRIGEVSYRSAGGAIGTMEYSTPPSPY